MKYVVDITNPPHSPPEREYRMISGYELETPDSKREMAKYNRYMEAYLYAQAIEERKNNERKND